MTMTAISCFFFFFSSRRRHTRCGRDWSSDVCSSDLHPRELTPEFRAACLRLAKAGIPLLGQTVLLEGVNDEAAVLERLFRGLVAARVKPYYLHHPDLARGTGHFRVDLRDGQALMRRLRGRVSGLCQPSYVLDLPDGLGKVPVGPCYAESMETTWIVEDLDGGRHRYPPREGGE